MLKQHPILLGFLFTAAYILLRSGIDHFQGIGFTAEIDRHLFVGAFTGLLLYFWQFGKVGRNTSEQ